MGRGGLMKRNITACLVFLMLVAGCSDGGLDVDRDRGLLDQMEAEIDLLIGQAPCKEPGGCRSIAFGAKPCGGPWSYKIYSASGVDSTALAELVVQYNEFNLVLNDRYGWVSDCMFVSEPYLDCLDGRCIPVSPP